jgi:hypothetical protein
VFRWENNIEMDHKEIGWRDVGGIYLSQDGDKWQAVVNMVMNHQVL